MSSKVVRVCVESLQGIVAYTSQNRLACEAASVFLAYLLIVFLADLFFAYLFLFFSLIFLLICTSQSRLYSYVLEISSLSLDFDLLLFLFDATVVSMTY